MKCDLCTKNKTHSWLYYGIFAGFLLGFFYFALGVYTHSHEKHHLNKQHLEASLFDGGTIGMA